MRTPVSDTDLLVAQNVPPKATPGIAQDASPPAPAGGGGGGPFGPMSMMLLMLAMMVPILLLSNRRQRKEAQARASLKKGDRVTTNAGLIGELVELDDHVAKVKLAAGVTVQFLANTVSPYVEPEKAKDLKRAKAASDKK